MRAATAFAILAALLALPTAQAVGEGAFTATAVRAEGPDPGTLEGELAIFVIEASGDDAGTLVPPFDAVAARIHLERDVAGIAARAEVANRSAGSYLFPSTEQSDHGAARLEWLANRAGFGLHVLPLRDAPAPIVAIRRGCFAMTQVEVDRALEGEDVDVHVATNRSGLVVPLRDAFAVHPCGDGAELEVRGSFLLHLWEVDVVLDEDGERRTLYSGHDPKHPAATLPAGASEAQELYVAMTDARLAIPFTGGAVAYARSLGGHLDGRIAVEGATGTLHGDQDLVSLDGEAVDLRGGPVALRIVGHGSDPMEVFILGGWNQATVDGQLVEAAATSTAAPAGPALAAALALLGAAAARRRARRPV